MQDYLSTLVSIDGTYVGSTKNLSFEDVKNRVTSYFMEREIEWKALGYTNMLNLGLGLAKYDFHEAPSNWDAHEHRDPHEKIIYEWAEYVYKNEKEYEDHIEYICEEYNKGSIPDAYDLLEDYFC